MTASFAATLRQLMLDRKMSRSMLARKVWGTVKDKRGYDVARNRDRIGHYLTGKSFPAPDNLKKIAKALGAEPKALEKLRPAPSLEPAGKRTKIILDASDLSEGSIALIKDLIEFGL